MCQGLNRKCSMHTNNAAAADVAAHDYADTLEHQERTADGKDIDAWLRLCLFDDDTEEDGV